MPRQKEKVRTANMFCDVAPVNKNYAKKRARQEGISYSQVVDSLLSRDRAKKTSHDRRAA